MVFAELTTINNDMSSTTSGGGSFTNLNSSFVQPARSNPQANPTTTGSTEISLPTYNTNDPQAILKALIRFVMRTFYDIPKSLVMEYIYQYERISDEDLAQLLRLDPKTIRMYIQEFKRDKFIHEELRLKSNQSNTGPRTQDQYSYKISIETFINVVKYRLINMQMDVEKLERQQTYRQSLYKCEKCFIEYTELDVGKLYDISMDALVCKCGGTVQEDEASREAAIANGQTVNMSLFNEQMKPLFQILERIDEIMKADQQIKNANDQDPFDRDGNHTSGSRSTRDDPSSNRHPSRASYVFERTAALSHDIQVVIEKDEDDLYSQMDVDETSNTADSMISSSRGPGKAGKKSKTTTSTAEVATQPLLANMKLSSKKTPYEPKPLPHWFVRSTVFVDHDEEHRLNNQSSNSTTHPSTISRQLSNQKLTKSASIQDIKQMLLVHESRRQKTLPLATMEDSLSPPTPLQMTKTMD